MNPFSEIKKPTSTAEPDFVSERKNQENNYSFECTLCREKLKIDFLRQIDNSWKGKSELITESEQIELKAFYKIGLQGKAPNGGFPVFDRIDCSVCRQIYFIYCGVREFSNSAFLIDVLGILKRQ